MINKFLISTLILAFTISACQALFGIELGRLQSAGVEGILLCEGEPAVGVKVKLYDDDRGLDTDDKMAEGVTDSEGHFHIEGTATELSTIDPKLNIYHDCHDLLPCQRKFTIKIPDSYISSGKTPERIYNARTIELEGEFGGEKRDCLN